MFSMVVCSLVGCMCWFVDLLQNRCRCAVVVLSSDKVFSIYPLDMLENLVFFLLFTGLPVN